MKLRQAIIGYIYVRLCFGCPQRGQGVAEDLAQETILAVLYSEVFLSKENWAYIRKVADSKVVDCKRKHHNECFGWREWAPLPGLLPRDVADLWEFERLWQLLATDGGPPEEVVCFIWVKLLECPPEEFVTQKGNIPIATLLEEGIRLFAEETGQPLKVVKSPFESILNQAPENPLGDFVQCKNNPARAVSRAVENVRRRILRRIGERR
jgi:hypothetical protein